MIVVAAIYLFECACWVRREASCLCTVLGRFRALPSPSFMGNERYKLAMGNPSPLARCFICESWPIRVSAEGVCVPEGISNSPARGTLCHFAFDDIADAIVAVEKEIRVNGRVIAKCASEQQAGRLVSMLKEVAAASAAERGRIIGEHLDRWIDNAATADRFAVLKALSDPLRTSGCTLFSLAFIVGPALYYSPCYSPWTPTWPIVVLYFVLLLSIWMITVWDYATCRKRLLGENFSARFRHTGMLLLSPASAMRSPETLLRNGLAEFHPLAVAAALCTNDRFASLARPMILALEYPMPSEVPSEATACRIDAWFRKKLLKRLHALLHRMEINADELLQPAQPLADSRSYCPRCHNQFVMAEGTCPDCGGLALVAYSGNSQPFKAYGRIER